MEYLKNIWRKAVTGTLTGLAALVLASSACNKDDPACRQWDLDRDGKKDREICLYDWNADGKIGEIDDLIMREYDSKGNIPKEIVDYMADGKPDRILVYERDGKGNLTKIIADNDADGKTDYIVVIEYDSKGNRTFKDTMDNNADGKPDLIWERERGWREITNLY